MKSTKLISLSFALCSLALFGSAGCATDQGTGSIHDEASDHDQEGDKFVGDAGTLATPRTVCELRFQCDGNDEPSKSEFEDCIGIYTQYAQECFDCENSQYCEDVDQDADSDGISDSCEASCVEGSSESLD